MKPLEVGNIKVQMMQEKELQEYNVCAYDASS
jgi:hypothetical protein